ncbi:hypothetical protein ACNF42_08310 [Cuniculiplasma sp. SKW3]|uniref:hypothetical protein n=1 Tax=Cuniculiplasma sp. SKW3 TaxID=3400170 RepID=UPI003FD6624F
MKDRQGRGWIERHREKNFESGFHDDVKGELKKIINENGNIESLKNFTSRRSLIRSLIPQMMTGILLSYIEYRIVGLLYTVASIVIFVPALSMYARSLRTRSGTFLMVPQDGAMDWDRIFVSEEIWSLVEKKTGLTLEQGKINGRITYWCTDVKYVPGTSIPYYVEIAWAHYNRAKYMMFASVIDDLTEMLQNALLEVAKLKQTNKVEAIVEGTRQTKEMINHIESAFRDNAYDIIKKQDLDEEQAEVYQAQVEELLQNPTFLRALAEKRKKEAEEVEK